MPLARSRYACPASSNSVTPSPRTMRMGARLYVPSSAFSVEADGATVADTSDGETAVAMGQGLVRRERSGRRRGRGPGDDGGAAGRVGQRGEVADAHAADAAGERRLRGVQLGGHAAARGAGAHERGRPVG